MRNRARRPWLRNAGESQRAHDARRTRDMSRSRRFHATLRCATRARPPPHAGLLDAMKIKTMVDVLPGHPPWRLGHVRVMGLKSHYFLMIWKDERYVPAPVADQSAVVEPAAGRNSAGNETKEVVQILP